jgi:hypothetical protein
MSTVNPSCRNLYLGSSERANKWNFDQLAGDIIISSQTKWLTQNFFRFAETLSFLGDDFFDKLLYLNILDDIQSDYMIFRIVSDIFFLIDLYIFGYYECVHLLFIEISLKEIKWLIFSVLETGLFVDWLEHIASLSVHW